MSFCDFSLVGPSHRNRTLQSRRYMGAVRHMLDTGFQGYVENVSFRGTLKGPFPLYVDPSWSVI